MLDFNSNEKSIFGYNFTIKAFYNDRGFLKYWSHRIIFRIYVLKGFSSVPFILWQNVKS